MENKLLKQLTTIMVTLTGTFNQSEFGSLILFTNFFTLDVVEGHQQKVLSSDFIIHEDGMIESAEFSSGKLTTMNGRFSLHNKQNQM